MNPLFQAMSGNNKMTQAMQIIKQLRNGNPEQIAHQMMNNNPNFRKFVNDNKGKTPEQVAKEHGIDLSQIMGMIK